MKIVFLNGDDAGKSVELTPSGLTIGRETDNHLQLPVGGVSRYHARIEFVEGAYMLRDLGSTNGTKLNGVVLQKLEPLKANDIIAIGEQQLRVDDPAPQGGKTDSKIGTSTVKIPAGIPVPEPAVPHFVFRPDSEPPSPPPVTDCSETATVNIVPEIAEAGNDFFAKRDGDGNLFKKEDGKKESGKSTLRGNLIFALVILIMICGGVLLFKAMNKEPEGKKKNEKAQEQIVTENNDFFFYYEVQSVNKKSRQLIRKKIYCREVDGVYCLDMFYDDYPVQIQKTVQLEEATIKRHRENRDIGDYAKGNSMTSVDPGNELEWTRLVIGVGSKVHDATVTGSSKDSSFRRAEDVVRRLILQTAPGKLMMSAEELRDEAKKAYGRAGNYYRNRENDPVDHSNALLAYLDVLEYYSAIRKLSARDEEDQATASERVKELSSKLQQIYDESVSKADIAFAQKNYIQAKKLCMEAKKYFAPQSDEYDALSRMENECMAKSREQQKGKK